MSAAPDRRTRLSRNLVANLLRFASIIGISFFLSPFIVQKLGTTGYGVWTLIAGLTGYLGLLDLGVRQSVNKFVSQHHAVGEHEDSSQIVSAALKLYLYAGAVALLLSIVLMWLAPVVFNIPAELAKDARAVILLSGISVGFSLVCGVFGGVVSGVQRFDVQCGLDVGFSLLRAAGVVVVLLLGWGLIGMAVVHLLAAIVNLLAYRLAAGSLYAQLQVSLSASLRPQFKRISGFAAGFFAIHVLSTIAFQSDNIVIGVVLPIEAVGFYAIAATLIKQSNSLTEALAHLMMPRISAMASRGDAVGDDILRSARIATLLISSIAVTFLLRGESFIALWMRPSIAAESGPVLGILSVVLWLGAVRAIVFNSVAGLGRHRVLLPGVALEAAANLAISIALVGPLGIVGVALGTLLPNLVSNLYFFPRCLQRVVGVAPRALYLHGLLRPMLAALPFAVASYWVETRYPAANLWEFFGQIIPVVAIAAVDGHSRQSFGRRTAPAAAGLRPFLIGGGRCVTTIPYGLPT